MASTTRFTKRPKAALGCGKALSGGASRRPATHQSDTAVVRGVTTNCIPLGEAGPGSWTYREADEAGEAGGQQEGKKPQDNQPIGEEQ